jgi:hypothetical protein
MFGNSLEMLCNTVMHLPEGQNAKP